MKTTRTVFPVLARRNELESREFVEFMRKLNVLSDKYGLRQITNWSKIWEYPWLWFHGLAEIDWVGRIVCDFGSELSPFPWYLASLGAKVTLVECAPEFVPVWARIREQMNVSIDWLIVPDEGVPVADHSVDVVTSFSVIEHQRDKRRAIDEVARILRHGGIFAVSFDICDPQRGMTFPAWNGSALTSQQFEEEIWNHPAFPHEGGPIDWNFEDASEFIRWHLQSAPHHNYTVGAAILERE